MDPEIEGMSGAHELLPRLESQVPCDDLTAEASTSVNDNSTVKPESVDSSQISDTQMTATEQSRNEKQPSSESKSANNLHSVAISSDTLVGSAIPLNNLPPEEAVFSIQKIHCKILSHLSAPDLRNCRLVSRSFRLHATNKSLLEWKRNKIYICGTGVNSYPESMVFGIRSYSTLTEFTTLLDDTSPVNPFPCDRFSMVISIEDDHSDIQNFFTRHGFRIRHIHLKFHYNNRRHSLLDENICLCAINKTVLFLTKLLCEQAPNLQILSMCFLGSAKEHEGEKVCQFSPANNVQAEKDFSLTNFTIAPKLRLIKLWRPRDKIPAPVLERLFQLSANLQELITDTYDYCIEPKNRLNLCKKMKFETQDFFVGNFDAYKIIANYDNTFKWDLKHLEILPLNLACCVPVSSDEVDNLNKILEKCCHSLEKLVWAPFRHFPGLNIPRMPKVKIIRFLDPSTENENDSVQNYFFPEGFCMSEHFPNLSTIKLAEVVASYNLKTVLIRNVNEIVNSVKIVEVNDNPFVDLQQLQKWFPNANIIKESRNPNLHGWSRKRFLL